MKITDAPMTTQSRFRLEAESCHLRLEIGRRIGGIGRG